MTRDGRRTGQSGQASVEFAVLLPVVLVLVAFVVQVGLLVRDRVTLVHDTRVAARAVVVEPTTTAARAALDGAGSAANRSISLTGSTAPGALVTVTVTAPPTRLPLFGRVLGDAQLSEQLTVMVEGRG